MADPKPATMAARAADAFADHGPAWPLSAFNLRVGRRRHGRPLRRLLLHREPDRRHRGSLMGGAARRLGQRARVHPEGDRGVLDLLLLPPIKEALRAGGSIGEVCGAM